MPTVTEDLDLAGGVDPASVTVTIEPWGAGLPVTAFNQTTGKTIGGQRRPDIQTGATWSIVLDGNAALIPAGTVYRCLRTWPGNSKALEDFITVPTTGGPYRVDQVLTTVPATIEDSALSAHKKLLHIPNVIVSAGFGGRWRPSKSEAATRRVPIHMWGDSVMAAGLGSSNQRTLSVPGLIQSTLQTAYGNGGSGFLSHEYATSTGTWTGATYGGLGATSVRATAAATLSWTGMVGTTIRLYFRNLTGGSFRYRIDGGTFTTITPPVQFGLEPGVVEITGLADIGHTVDIEWVSGTVWVHGVTAYRATGIVLNRFGQLGRAGSELGPMLAERIPNVTTTNASATITTPTPGSFRNLHSGRYVVGPGIGVDTTITAIASATSATLSVNATASGTVSLDVQHNRQSLADAAAISSDQAFGEGRPDLVIVAVGGVDAIDTSGNMTPATWREGASRVVRQYTDGNVYDFTPDFLFVIEHAGDMTDFRDRYAAIASEIAAFGQSVGGAVADVWGLGRRSWKYWNTQPGGTFWFDAVHPNDAGCAATATLITDLLKLV